MRPPLPSGYLSWGALPDWSRIRPCRYCGVEMAAHRPDPVCQGEECRANLKAKQRAQRARYDRQYAERKRA
jgi:predicted nucleic acid-binding Zn ribbon protein